MDVTRRQLLAALVAAGASSSTAACLEPDSGEPETELEDAVHETSQSSSEDREQEPPSRPAVRQHAWNDYLNNRGTEKHPVPALPVHNLILHLDFSREGPPSESERGTVESVLGTLEQAYEWSPSGLLFTVGYSPYYFDRFDGELPDSVDLPEPEPLVDRESPEIYEHDTALYMTSNKASNILAAEEALFGDRDYVDGVEFDRGLNDVFDRVRRQTGFLLRGKEVDGDLEEVFEESVVPTMKDVVPDSVTISEDRPFFMGGPTNIARSHASEDRVTIDEGRFRGGTTQHIETLSLDLEAWSQHDKTRQMKLLFNAGTTVESSGSYQEQVERSNPDIRKHIEEYGMVGHAEKVARAREEGDPVVLLREFNTTDTGRAGMRFVTNQASISDYVKTRMAMYGLDIAEEYDEIGERADNGVLEYITVETRGSYLVPPRQLRSLPEPQ